MIERPNKVFYTARELNFLQTPFNLDEIKNNIVKSLVSGHGPFPIVSVKVVNKRATVDIGEQVRLYSGVKISIEGTNVTALDTWHEVQAIDGNKFEFDVEAPDGNYTSGVSMGYPAFGWRLLDRDANRILLQSGISGSQPHQVLLTFNRGRPNWGEGENWRNTMGIEKVESDGTLASVRNPIPSNYQIGMKMPIEMATPLNYDHSWYFYGDDSFVIFGYRGWWQGNNMYLKRANFNQVMFGELSRNQYKNGAFFINAEPNIQTFWERNYGDNGQQLTFSIWAGCLAGIVTNNHASVLISTTVNEVNNYGDQANVYATGYLPAGEGRTGFNFGLGVSKYLNNNYYNTPMVANRRYEMVGEIPGVLFLSMAPHMAPAFTYKAPNNVDTIESMFKPLKLKGRLKDRKVYAFYSGDYNAWQNGSNGPGDMWVPYQSIAALDLSGPIR